ncbi:MAG TPA: ImmA/IrrE family metallo-endopeptidase [Atribacteraceae bacterium]|nr:ImmA/IrrE family metallo-endopeptidase [Atribacteraceae bacterium]
MHGTQKAVALCEAEGIEIAFHPFVNFTGMLVSKGNWIHLTVRDDLSETETVRVLLHELGHHCLHVTNRFSTIFHGHQHQVTGEEKEADFFAFCLAGDHIRERVRWNFIEYGPGWSGLRWENGAGP